MNIIKASAGSGKTYTLSREYIKILLESDDRYAYRHVLAVTFTNKATAEMKSRILRDLYEMSRENPKAGRILTDILHDYSAFAVSTIDKFFQQVLHAFSREIGQFASYQVELDKDSLITEAVDRILDNLSEDDRELMEWLRQCVAEKVELGEKYKIDGALYDIAGRLGNEEYRNLREKFGIDESEAFSKLRLDGIRNSCRKTIRAFEDGVRALGLDVRRGSRISVPLKRDFKAHPGLEEYFDDNYGNYSSAVIIDGLISSLGIAGEFRKSFNELLKEKNVLPLDDSNTLLKQIIDGSDTPFVYEKMGVRFQHFLLDEFQDTSGIQWDNFLPLLRESESGEGGSLVVGDVKQSIYRWRGSEWKLLGEDVLKAFPDASERTLGVNWRSAYNIVDFNSEFFEYAASKLCIREIYSDVRQTAHSVEPGCVRVSFLSNQEQAVLDSVAAALEKGARQSDIAVLVRTGGQGSSLAALLIGAGYSVISDDSLNVKSSPAIRKLTSLLYNFDNPGNSVGSYLASSLNITYPTEYHSLTDLCECLLRELQKSDPGILEGQTWFINAFLDELQAWVKTNGNNLRSFLKWWEDSDVKISSPETADAIRIITVHKSKGLEFPYVIFPYAESVKMYRADTHWCHLESKGSPLDGKADGLYPVTLYANTAGTLFGKAFEEESFKQKVDNINVFYVAMTRASRTLHVIAAEPPAVLRKALKDGKEPKWGDLSQLLFAFVGQNFEYRRGEDYDFASMQRDDKRKADDWKTEFVSFAPGGRLEPSQKAADFFGEDGVTGTAASARLYGIVLHDILSCVRNAADLWPAVDCAVRDGAISAVQAAAAEKLLRSRIEAHPLWFPDDISGLEINNEKPIIDSDGNEYRPDRVVISKDSVEIIDYKFGEESKSYLRQVGRYMQLYRRMGYDNVHGSVWYIPDDKVDSVIQ